MFGAFWFLFSTKEDVDTVKLFLRDHGCMFALEYLSFRFEGACVEDIIQHPIKCPEREFSSSCFPVFERPISPLFVRDFANFGRIACPREEHIPHPTDEGKSLLVDLNLLCEGIILVSLWSSSWEPSFRSLTLHTTRDILPQIHDELIRHTRLDAHEKSRIHGMVLSIARDDTIHFSFLEHILDRPRIHRISGEAIKLPAEDDSDIFPFHPLEHLIEDGSFLRSLCGFFFGEYLDNIKPHIACSPHPVVLLVFDGLDLFFLALGRLSSVQKAFRFHKNHR